MIQRLECSRQQDQESRSDTNLAVNGEAATCLTDDSVAGRQAEAGSPAPNAAGRRTHLSQRLDAHGVRQRGHMRALIATKLTIEKILDFNQDLQSWRLVCVVAVQFPSRATC